MSTQDNLPLPMDEQIQWFIDYLEHYCGEGCNSAEEYQERAIIATEAVGRFCDSLEEEGHLDWEIEDYLQGWKSRLSDYLAYDDAFNHHIRKYQ